MLRTIRCAAFALLALAAAPVAANAQGQVGFYEVTYTAGANNVPGMTPGMTWPGAHVFQPGPPVQHSFLIDGVSMDPCYTQWTGLFPGIGPAVLLVECPPHYAYFHMSYH